MLSNRLNLNLKLVEFRPPAKHSKDRVTVVFRYGRQMGQICDALPNWCQLSTAEVPPSEDVSPVALLRNATPRSQPVRQTRRRAVAACHEKRLGYAGTYLKRSDFVYLRCHCCEMRIGSRENIGALRSVRHPFTGSGWRYRPNVRLIFWRCEESLS